MKNQLKSLFDTHDKIQSIVIGALLMGVLTLFTGNGFISFFIICPLAIVLNVWAEMKE